MEGASCELRELAGLGRHMSKPLIWSLEGAGCGEGPGTPVSHRKGSRGAGSENQVPGWAASWLCGLGQVSPSWFQPPIGKMAHRGVEEDLSVHEDCAVNTLGLQVGGVIGGARIHREESCTASCRAEHWGLGTGGPSRGGPPLQPRHSWTLGASEEVCFQMSPGFLGSGQAVPAGRLGVLPG